MHYRRPLYLTSSSRCVLAKVGDAVKTDRGIEKIDTTCGEIAGNGTDVIHWGR